MPLKPTILYRTVYKERMNTMNKIINIEQNNERVLTTEQLAQVYGCETKRISENFKRNEERFEEGKHYFKLDGDALRDFKITNPQIADNLKFAPVIMLWTRRGASRHSKMNPGNSKSVAESCTCFWK